MTYHLHAAIDDSETIVQRLREWLAACPEGGVLALVTERERSRVPELQALCRDIGIPLLGAVFPEIHLAGQFHDQGALLILLNPMTDFYRLIEFTPDEGGALTQAEALADEVEAAITDPESTTLLMMFDALVPNISSILETLYLTLAESVHYAGGNAGSETFQPIPCLFDSERLIGNGLLAMLLRGNRGAALEHGYEAPDQLIAATATDGNRIISIGWQPAFDVYSEHVKQLYGVEVTRDNFYDFGVHFPFGILRADDEVLVRIPVKLEADGSLFCVGEVPEHTVLTLLEAPDASSLQTARLLAERLHGERQPVLNFYCAGRRVHLGEEAATRELLGLYKNLDCETLFGAISLGEIGSSQHGGYPLFHHAALVCMRL